MVVNTIKENLSVNKKIATRKEIVQMQADQAGYDGGTAHRTDSAGGCRWQRTDENTDSSGKAASTGTQSVF